MALWRCSQNEKHNVLLNIYFIKTEMKGFLYVVLYSVFLCILFSVMCFLMSTVNPDPLAPITIATSATVDPGSLRRVNFADEYYKVSLLFIYNDISHDLMSNLYCIIRDKYLLILYLTSTQ